MKINYNKEIGEKLRQIRRERGYSLEGVQKKTKGQFKASILGAYERGERSLSLPRLYELMKFYKVSLDSLLPVADKVPSSVLSKGIRLNLNRVEVLPPRQRALLGRYIDFIKEQRNDTGTEVITIREDDLNSLACLLNISPKIFHQKLKKYGVWYQ